MTQITHDATTGVGLGLRWAFLDEALSAALPGALAFFELSPENYMRRGGYYPQALRRLQARRPLLSHGLMLDIGGSDPLDEHYLRELRGFLDAFGFAAHSDHLCWSRSAGRYFHELLPLAHTRAEARRIAERVSRVQSRLARPLSLENISAYAGVGQRLDPAREADFICELLDRADCGLLLDLNNAAVNGINHGFDPWAFISRLPLDRVASLHVGGGERRPDLENRLIDTHGTSVSAQVLDLMRRVVEQIGPCAVLYERDNALPSFGELCAEVCSLDAVYQAALAQHASATKPGPTEDATIGSSVAQRFADDESSMPVFDKVACGDYFLATKRCAAGTNAEGLRGTSVPPNLQADDANLYRRLVRGALRAPIDSFLERSSARSGAAFETWVDNWLAAGASRSPYLRDLPGEFVDWLAAHPEQLSDVGADAWLLDLLRHELVHYEVAGAVSPPHHSDSPTLDLQRPLEARRALKRVRYGYAVHELSAALDANDEPQQRTCDLLVYRDEQHLIHYLELETFAATLVDHLLDGLGLEASLRETLGQASGALPDEQLSRAGAIVADLLQRGVLR